MHRRQFLFAMGLVLAAGAARAQPALQTFDKSNLVIDTADGPQHFNVELALTPAQEEQGLMYRQSLAADAGMLFDFGNTDTRTFWMKNTLIPLDMLFVGSDGRIVDIHERAIPMTEDVIASRVPCRAVLELNGGTVARLGIKVGDVVHYRGFGNAS